MDEEIGMYLRVIEQGLVSIVSCFDGLSPAEVHAHPIAGANSLAIIVRHSLANAHRNVLASFAGEPYDYHRDAEFVDDGETVASMVATWAELRERMHKALAPFTAADLPTPREHARMGTVPGRRVLLQAAIHVAEHSGEAQLTRQLVIAQRM